MIYKHVFFAFLFVFALSFPGGAFAQGATVDFGALKHDSSQPVEITADQLQIDQETGKALFQGNVVVWQGDMRLLAAKVEVEYRENDSATGRVERLRASGGVTLVSGAEAAEAAEAVYSIGSSQIVMSGNVLLTQGRNALSGEKLTVNLDKGAGIIEGRVKTVFQSGNGN